mmetsp:Transcript_12595/g.51064  ORF Transcript_12595/g.51064 Transcript_12595/m.51064 type:complete len:87 (+) Transcript_12595:143-403(+)
MAFGNVFNVYRLSDKGRAGLPGLLDRSILLAPFCYCSLLLPLHSRPARLLLASRVFTVGGLPLEWQQLERLHRAILMEEKNQFVNG